MLFRLVSWYGGLSKALKDKLQVSQNKLIRLVLGLSPRDHIGKERFQQLGWLPIDARAVQLQLSMVYNICNNRVPVYLKDYLKRSGDTHDHHTRASVADLCLPRFKTKMGKNSFRFSGAVNWNMLPLEIKSISSVCSFKTKVQSWHRENVSAY